jgi:ankyrin repeat protein
MMRVGIAIAACVAAACLARAQAMLTVNQQLIVACHRVDVDGVVAAIRAGANVNGRFGEGDTKVFQDPWSLGWPLAGKAWTPLMALASSSKYPDPPRNVESTIADLNWAREEQKKITPSRTEQRERDSLTILWILLSHKAEIDADDGYGATALYEAIYEKKEAMAKVLLQSGAKVNTKTGIYIDGSGDITPLHRAYWSAELTRLLVEKGADAKAKSTTGETPVDWARQHGDAAVLRVYESQ